MKFTILSHAGISIEHRGMQIVADPWLLGSCYWRSWWNFPEAPPGVIEALRPNYIYLTHLHWDHFHGVSLQRLFDPSTPIIVPKVPTRRMVDDLQWLGFHNIVEIPHGEAFRLGEDFTLWSYQNGPAVDSAMLVKGGDVVLFDCNDCKYFGLPLAQITRRFPKIDFVLRSHSSASPIPYCIDGYTTAFPQLRSQQKYIDEFCRFALHVGARYAVPFASNHCFLHRDTAQFNETSVSPEDVQRHYKRLAASTNRESECVIMAPGSSWSDVDSFQIVAFDYAQRKEYVEQLRGKYAKTLEQQYARESEATADFETFESYFKAFLAALPWILKRWLNFAVVFHVVDSKGEHYWRVDLGRRTVAAVANADNAAVVIETPALVLNDCTRLRMFSVWGASKRLKIRLRTPADLSAANKLTSLLDLYELETLPLSRNFSLRSLSVRLRRWRDAAEAALLIFKHGLLRRPFDVSALYPVPERTDAN